MQSSFDTTGASKSFCKCPSETGTSFDVPSPASATPFAGDGADGEPRGDEPGPSFDLSRCSCPCCLSLLTHLSSRFFPLPGLLLRSYPLGLTLSFAASCSRPHSISAGDSILARTTTHFKLRYGSYRHSSRYLARAHALGVRSVGVSPGPSTVSRFSRDPSLTEHGVAYRADGMIFIFRRLRSPAHRRRGRRRRVDAPDAPATGFLPSPSHALSFI
jgi:hypothetical protein